VTVLERNNVTVTGSQDGQGSPVVFAHGFGCDQQMWRFVAPAFEAGHQVVLFDHIGCGKSHLAAYDDIRHSTLDGYAQDLAEVLEACHLRNATVVGHSVSAMIAVLASLRVPERVARLVLVGPSPRYLNDPPHYLGGFERSDIDALLDMMETNMLGWANYLAPAVMGLGLETELTEELRGSFCAIDPYITQRFARTTFLADNRADLPKVQVPTLIIQCSDDAIAPRAVGEYVHRHISGSQFEVIQASGHCPHMTHPAQTVALIQRFIAAD
jgi:sigma-B regulation protein RsbQ